MNGPKDASEPGEAAVLRSPMVVAADVMKTFCFNFTFNLEVCFTNLSYIACSYREQNHKSIAFILLFLFFYIYFYCFFLFVLSLNRWKTELLASLKFKWRHTRRVMPRNTNSPKLLISYFYSWFFTFILIIFSYLYFK